jgi:hypothetical protein
VFAFCSHFSDNENSKRDAAIASLIDTPAADEQPFQEAAVVVKSLEAPVKKGTSCCASKRLKKAPVASTSLDTHRPVGHWWTVLGTIPGRGPVSPRQKQCIWPIKFKIYIQI